MIKTTIFTHTLDYCVKLIINNIQQEFSVPQVAKLVVVYASDLIYVVIMPHNKDNGYFLPLEVQDILFRDQYSSIKSIHNKLCKVPAYQIRDQLSQITNFILDRDIEYKHSPDNFINVVNEYKEEIGNILIDELKP